MHALVVFELSYYFYLFYLRGDLNARHMITIYKWVSGRNGTTVNRARSLEDGYFQISKMAGDTRFLLAFLDHIPILPFMLMFIY